MKILRGYQKQTRAGDGKLKPQFPRPNSNDNKNIMLYYVFTMFSSYRVPITLQRSLAQNKQIIKSKEKISQLTCVIRHFWLILVHRL